MFAPVFWIWRFHLPLFREGELTVLSTSWKDINTLDMNDLRIDPNFFCTDLMSIYFSIGQSVYFLSLSVSLPNGTHLSSPTSSQGPRTWLQTSTESSKLWPAKIWAAGQVQPQHRASGERRRIESWKGLQATGRGPAEASSTRTEKRRRAGRRVSGEKKIKFLAETRSNSQFIWVGSRSLQLAVYMSRVQREK